MNATNKQGHVWTGESEKDSGSTWFNYCDEKGNEYQSKEVPAYRVVMDNSCFVNVNGKWAIGPLCCVDL